jgi:RNA polymerase sigma factor (sigma-70 family)
LEQDNSVTPSEDGRRRPPSLDQIKTDWAIIRMPGRIVERYADAVREYLRAILHDPDDAEEVAQEFFLRIAETGLPHVRRERGRLRDYIKKAVRNTALNHLRTRRRAEQATTNLPDRAASPTDPDQGWLARWRECLLDRSWRALEAHQQQAPDSLFSTVLALAVAHPDESSDSLAARAAAVCGHPLKADAFRKQLSRARRKFTELLIQEVAQTLDTPEPNQIEEELVDLGLMAYVRDLLPDNWRDRKKPADGV